MKMAVPQPVVDMFTNEGTLTLLLLRLLHAVYESNGLPKLCGEHLSSDVYLPTGPLKLHLLVAKELSGGYTLT